MTTAEAAPIASDAPDPAHPGGAAPPRVSGALPFLGHLLELRRRPLDLLARARREAGEVAELRLARLPLVMLYGEEAQEAFFRAPDEQLDQGAAYPFMKPIFGAGVVFDAPPERRKEALRNQSLRDKQMRGHAEVIARETERMVEGFGDEGEIDLLEFFAELTIYTSSACLIGKPFREELTSEFARVYHDLECGTDAIAFVNAHLPIPSFRKRDRARRRLVELVTEIMDARRRAGEKKGDLLDVLMHLKGADGGLRFSADEITGMFISMMFAGHHTTSGTAAWTLIELLRHPAHLARVTSELDTLYADGSEVSYHALRDIPQLENAIKEALRLHPPLVLLLRKVVHDFHYKGFTIHAGKLVGTSPAVSNRLPECFPDPERFDPERYVEGREEDRLHPFGWIPFGAGRHRCVGAAFAMIQLKAVFSVLLPRFEFSLAQPSASYRSDHSKMVVQLVQPCRVRYRRRASGAPA
jgi:sterol 14-demethylase